MFNIKTMTGKTWALCSTSKIKTTYSPFFNYCGRSRDHFCFQDKFDTRHPTLLYLFLGLLLMITQFRVIFASCSTSIRNLQFLGIVFNIDVRNNLQPVLRVLGCVPRPLQSLRPVWHQKPYSFILIPWLLLRSLE